jgi:hypothetical protein
MSVLGRSEPGIFLENLGIQSLGKHTAAQIGAVGWPELDLLDPFHIGRPGVSIKFTPVFFHGTYVIMNRR